MKSYNEKVKWARELTNIPVLSKIVWAEQNDDGSMDIYHTDSPFWYDFFHSDEHRQNIKEKMDGDKVDMSIVTLNGKVIHVFNKEE